MPAGDETQRPVAEIDHDQLQRIARVRASANTVTIPVFLVTDHVDSVPEHLHDITSRNVMNSQLTIVERDLVTVRIEAAPVDHHVILSYSIRVGCKHPPPS